MFSNKRDGCNQSLVAAISSVGLPSLGASMGAFPGILAGETPHIFLNIHPLKIGEDEYETIFDVDKYFSSFRVETKPPTSLSGVFFGDLIFFLSPVSLVDMRQKMVLLFEKTCQNDILQEGERVIATISLELRYIYIHPGKFAASPLKNDSWFRQLSF